MFTLNLVQTDKDEATFFDNCFVYYNETYCTQDTTRTTISPTIMPSFNEPIQENNTDLGKSVDVLLLGVAMLFLAIALLLGRRLTQQKKKIESILAISDERHEKILALEEQLVESEFRQPQSGQIESLVADAEVASHQNQAFPYTFDALVYRAPKSDEVIETCADMALVNISDQIFTIADGVSQAFNSARWSELLVQNVTTSCDTPTLVDFTPRIARDWDDDCNELLKNEDPQSFTRQKQLQGSQSTLASLRLFRRNNDLYWRFHTIGDSLLLIIDASNRPNLVQKSLPFSKVEDFPSSPDILSTKAPHLRGHIKTFEILSVENQIMLLMTDALARYAVSHGSPGISIDSIFPFLGGSDADFADWLQKARQNGLGDDDSTMIAIYPHNE
jgi:hypothetical protein